jgi:hypothetical protein
MPSDQDIDDASPVAPRSIPGGELKARIRAELASHFTWPDSLMPVTRPLQDLSAVMDLRELARVAAAVENGKELSFTLISKEYIKTGFNWINAMLRLDLKNFLIIAGDRFTSEALDERGIPSVHADIDESEFDASFVTPIGFSAKGLAMIALKFPVAKFLSECGYSVVFSDADAVWLQDPMPHLSDADIAFQRVIYHPPAIAPLWGFTACTGFVFFRHGKKTIAFLDRCIKAHQSFYCDQVAMNVALFESDPAWRCEQVPWNPPGAGVWEDQSQRRAAFSKFMQFPIKGELRPNGALVLALPHDKFWRHRWVASSPPEMVICHPNSPKDDLEKMKALGALGVRFPPGVGDRTSKGIRSNEAG